MATAKPKFTEVRILSQVTHLPAADAVNVQWTNQVLKDDIVLSSTYERKAYTKDQKAEFLAEVDNAQAYITAFGW
jgi:hypothetical protein